MANSAIHSSDMLIRCDSSDCMISNEFLVPDKDAAKTDQELAELAEVESSIWETNQSTLIAPSSPFPAQGDQARMLKPGRPIRRKHPITYATGISKQRKSLYRLCECGIRRSRCKDHGGTEVCIHNRRQMDCVQCGGRGICKHNKRRRSCKECGSGSSSSEVSPCKAGGGQGREDDRDTSLIVRVSLSRLCKSCEFSDSFQAKFPQSRIWRSLK